MPTTGRRQRSLLATVTEDGYSARVIDVIQRIARAERRADVLELLHEAKREMGVEHALFVSFIRDDDTHESFRVLLACEWRWQSHYQEADWYLNDPWLQYSSAHTEPIAASQIRMTGGGRHGADSAMHYGMSSACVVPAPSSGGLMRVGVLGLGVDTPGYFEADGFTTFKVLARSLAMELNSWLVRQARRDLVKTARITPEDIELLNLQRQGLGSKEVAAVLNISAASVDSRWQRLNSRLGVPHRAGAARIAAEYGLI